MEKEGCYVTTGSHAGDLAQNRSTLKPFGEKKQKGPKKRREKTQKKRSGTTGSVGMRKKRGKTQFERK